MKVNKTIVDKIDKVLDRGLSKGLGDQNGQMCIEAAVCYALGLPHGDSPPCVGAAVRSFKITLNDSDWSSSEVRAKGMRKLAIAQLGSEVLDQTEFAKRLSEKIIRVLIPELFREVFPKNKECLEAANVCEKEGSYAAAAAAAYAADAAAYADADADAARAADRAYAADAARAADAAARAARAAARAADAAARAARAAARAYAAADAADAAADAAARAARAAARAAAARGGDKKLVLGAELCYQVLLEMKSPGAVWMNRYRK